MKLILLYGPPAVGKLTVAQELSKRLNIPVFHNHMILNPLRAIFGLENPVRAKLEREFRLRIIEEAIKDNKDVIMTGVATMKNYRDFYEQVIAMVEKAKGNVYLVRLTAPREVLQQRVTAQFRKDSSKIHTLKEWEAFEKLYPEMYEQLGRKKHLTIDTSQVSSSKAAEEIIATYHLI